jgi:membrane-bound lytic murein transglycosylase D
MRRKGKRFAGQLGVLLLVSAAVGAWSQTIESEPSLPVVSQVINRPLRSQRPDSSSFPIPHSSLSSPPSAILAPDVLTHPLTTYYIDRYSSAGGITWINSIIKNGGIYLPFVKEEIARRGLPPELAYLPFIESGYLSTARSKSGATGLWQFMMNSIAPYGIKVDDLIDERRDFRKSTVAALKKLEENYQALENWPLALAAYNAGLGGVSRSVKRTKTSDYWLLCEKNEFKQETVHYVPKFLAVAYILSNPRQFGVDYWPETLEWTTITPGKQISLDIIALEAGLDRNLLYRLNTELLHGITPADKNYELKIPQQQMKIVVGLLEKDNNQLLRHYFYQIQYGDTLSALSRHYSVSLDMIEQYNPGISKRYLKIGETVLIPAFKEIAPYTGTKAPNQSGGAFLGTHVISKGDTLWSLAIRYQVDPQFLAEENNMELDQILSIGKSLKVPIIE